MGGLRVKCVSHWYPHADNPHSGTFVEAMAQAVAPWAEVDVVRFGRWHDGGRRTVERRGGLNVTHVSIPASTSVERRIWRRATALYRELFERPVDLVHAHVYESVQAAALASAMADVPMVATEHASRIVRRELGRRDRWWTRLAMNSAKCVMPVGSGLQRALQELGVQAPMEIVPNVVSPEFQVALETRRRPDGVFRLLSVGKLHEGKGIDIALEALSTVKDMFGDWIYYVIGAEGPAADALRRQVVRLDLNNRVKFLGVRSKAEIASYLQQSDVFLLPSRLETFSVVTAEALCMGVPVVATRCGGPEDFVSADAGVFAAPGDVEALANAIMTLYREQARFDRDAIARRYRRCFAPEAVGQQLYEVYRRALTPV